MISAVTETLMKARDIIATRGLRAGWWGTSDGPVCALGALNEVVYGSPTVLWLDEAPKLDTMRVARELLTHVGTGGPFLLVAWSDTHSKEEVLAGFDAAISCSLDGASLEDLP